MDNFDLKKYLVENKVTMNSRLLAEQADAFAFSNDIQAVINQLTQMGSRGKQVLTTLQSMSEWNDLVQSAVDEESVDSFNTSNDLLSIVNQLISSGKKDVLNVLNSIDAWQDLMDSASMAEARKPKHSKMMNEQDSIPTAIQETATLLKKEGIPFTMVTEEEMEDELQNGIDPGEDTAKSVIKLKGSKGNVYIAEFGYGSIFVDAKNIDEDYPQFWEELGEDEYATDSGKDIIRVLKKYFMKSKNNSRMTQEGKSKFYAPQYLVQKHGKEMAKKIEAEIDEMDANSWDRFTAMESAKEVDDYIADILDMLK